jgi:phage tail P2-like protein
MTDLLPPNSTLLERAAATAACDALPVIARTLWSADECPAEHLPYLAWALSVDFWDMATTEAQQRDLIRGAITWHRKRGTPWAVKQALAAIGYPVLELVEQAEYHRQWTAAGGLTLDGAWSLDGSASLTPPADGSSVLRRTALNHWAEYAIRLNAVDGAWSVAQQARIRRIAEAYAPARSRLVAIITSLATRFGRPVQAVALQQRVRIRLAKCQRVQPLQRRTLDGCWSLGGNTAPLHLDGTQQLDGGTRLDGLRLLGTWSWAAGHARMGQRLRLQLRATVGTGTPAQPVDLAPRDLLLDGNTRLDALTLGGWPLDEGISLGDAALDRIGLHKLDGTWQLGPRPAAPRVRARITARIRQHGITQQVAL